jgi:hypothetical protein
MAGQRKKKWIQKAVPASHEGRFTDYCKRQGYKGVTNQCIAKAKSSGTIKRKRQAQFASAMRKK